MKSGNNHKTEKITLEDLSELKMQIKQRINLQEEQVKYSAKNLIPASPVKILSMVANTASAVMGLSSNTKKVTKGISIINGAVIGYKAAKGIIKILQKRRI